MLVDERALLLVQISGVRLGEPLVEIVLDSDEDVGAGLLPLAPVEDELLCLECRKQVTSYPLDLGLLLL